MYVAGRRRLVAQPGGLTLRFAPRLISHEVCTLNVLFFSRPRSEGWPHHGRTFSIYHCCYLIVIVRYFVNRAPGFYHFTFNAGLVQRSA